MGVYPQIHKYTVFLKLPVVQYQLVLAYHLECIRIAFQHYIQLHFQYLAVFCIYLATSKILHLLYTSLTIYSSTSFMVENCTKTAVMSNSEQLQNTSVDQKLIVQSRQSFKSFTSAFFQEFQFCSISIFFLLLLLLN